MRAIYEFLSRKSSSGRTGKVVPYSDTGDGCFAGAKKGPWHVCVHAGVSNRSTWVCMRACVSDRARPGRPVCRPA